MAAVQTPALLTDLYELTMANGYWKAQVAEREAVFHLTFRQHPFKSRYTVACGLATALEMLDEFRFDSSDIEYLASLVGSQGRPLFESEFLAYLGQLRLACDIDAIPEGTLVFPHEPLMCIRGPVLHCQILETLLLNVINFQSLIATKASRIVAAAGDDPVLEFGLRRAQGVDGGLAASRAAYVGGCAATSNVRAGKLHGIPVRGTHAHSWVMFFDSEPQAFERWSEAMPDNCIFLVDTYHSIEGVRNAIREGIKLRQHGHDMIGIRLDSGDMAALSIEARTMMDEAGLEAAKIVASGDLDEYQIASLKQAGARIDIWGVGTRLVTAYDEPALGGVYKLSAVKSESGEWVDKLKLSEEKEKSSLPGIQQVRRLTHNGRMAGDIIFDERSGCSQQGEDLLKPVYRHGSRVGDGESLEATRERLRMQLAAFPDGPDYPVGLEPHLSQVRDRLLRDVPSP